LHATGTDCELDVGEALPCLLHAAQPVEVTLHTATLGVVLGTTTRQIDLCAASVSEAAFSLGKQVSQGLRLPVGHGVNGFSEHDELVLSFGLCTLGTFERQLGFLATATKEKLD